MYIILHVLWWCHGQASKGEDALQPWNTGFYMAGDVTVSEGYLKTEAESHEIMMLWFLSSPFVFPGKARSIFPF